MFDIIRHKIIHFENWVEVKFRIILNTIKKS